MKMECPKCNEISLEHIDTLPDGRREYLCECGTYEVHAVMDATDVYADKMFNMFLKEFSVTDEHKLYRLAFLRGLTTGLHIAESIGKQSGDENAVNSNSKGR